MGESSVKISKQKTLTVVAITGRMTVDTIGDLKGGFLKAFELGKNVQLSLAGVTEVDLAGLQLLCSSHRTSIAREVGFVVTGAEGEVICSVAELSGMMRRTSCAEDINGTCVWQREK